MTHFWMFLASLMTTLMVCFLLPILTICLLLGLLTMAELSPLADLGQIGLDNTLDILSTFGGGSIWQGVLTLSLTLSLVGGLFDTYTFYGCQSIRE